MASQPQEEWPEGYEDEFAGVGLEVFTGFMVAITVFAIIGRFWSRSLISTSEPGQTRRYWWDDWTALAAVPLLLARFGSEFYMFSIGMGHHADTLPPDDLRLIMQLIFCNYFIYSAALFFAKESALFFYSRVFPQCANPTWFNVSIVVAHIMNVAWMIGIFFATLFQCLPIERNWDRSVPGTCVPNDSMWIANAVTSVFIDLVILVLPLPKIWSLHMHKGRKIAISIIFALGYCAPIVSIGRLVSVLNASNEQMQDITYGLIPILFWINAEGPVILLSVCLPAMLPLGRHLLSSYLSPLASRISTSLGLPSSRSSSVEESKVPSDFGTTERHVADMQTAELGSIRSSNSRRRMLSIPISPRTNSQDTMGDNSYAVAGSPCESSIWGYSNLNVNDGWRPVHYR